MSIVWCSVCYIIHILRCWEHHMTKCPVLKPETYSHLWFHIWLMQPCAEDLRRLWGALVKGVRGSRGAWEVHLWHEKPSTSQHQQDQGERKAEEIWSISRHHQGSTDLQVPVCSPERKEDEVHWSARWVQTGQYKWTRSVSLQVSINWSDVCV